ncbi:MAG: phosphate ABC transporter permease subunit PstC [Candidatus Ranarchaeia archaeon]
MKKSLTWGIYQMKKFYVYCIRSNNQLKETIGKFMLGSFAIVTSLITLFLFVFLWIEAAPSILTNGLEIFSDPVWDPNHGRYGIFTFTIGTLWTSGFAILIAVPLGVLAAVFLSEYCPKRIQYIFETIIMLMAAVPSVVYGLWAFYILVPALKNYWQPLLQRVLWWNPLFSGPTLGYGVLAGSLILTVMLLPTVIVICEEAIKLVPKEYREASLALGANCTETTFNIVLTTALPGMIAAVLLALGRAVGETMAILMVTGNSLNIPSSLYDTVYVMTSLIANQLGFAYNDPLYRSSIFSVALMLLIVSILFTALAKLTIYLSIKRGAR